MTILDKAARAGRVISAFLTDRANRAAYARRNRNTIVKHQQAGTPFTSPRKTWILDQSVVMADQLKRAKATYDALYPWDIILPEDMRDALNSTAGQLFASEHDHGDDDDE